MVLLCMYIELLFSRVIMIKLIIYYFIYICIIKIFVLYIENNLYDIFKMFFDVVFFKIFYIFVFI